MKILGLLGRWFLNSLRDGGRMVIFLSSAVIWMFLSPLKWRRMIARIHFIGAKSLLVIVLTGGFTGMVLALQVFYTLRKFGSEAFLGPAVALSLVRELGPVLCALMVTGRAGSALTAEIGIMRITEQIDALQAMALEPMRYLIVPTILAGLIAFPLLTAIFDLVGIYGGYLVGVQLLGVGEGTYFGQMETYVGLRDITQGILKSLSFGLLMTWVCCYKGFHAGYGAEGVSRATTEAVVLSSVLILVWDYFLGSVLLGI
ncbi:MAG: MlaE family lipid ABC transporter permease subunit [candidate division NC10 bacterium]